MTLKSIIFSSVVALLWIGALVFVNRRRSGYDDGWELLFILLAFAGGSAVFFGATFAIGELIIWVYDLEVR